MVIAVVEWIWDFNYALLDNLFQSPEIAIVIAGLYILTKSILPSGEKHAPANSELLRIFFPTR